MPEKATGEGDPRVSAAAVAAAVPVELILPSPQREANALTQLLGKRRSVRSYSDRMPDLQMLANLLWSAFGVSTADGYRTAPSARNWREIDVYVALKSGLYRYDAPSAALGSVLCEDIRALTGHQDFVAPAPVNLVYVADFERMGGATPKECEFYSAADVGAICENVYMFCAATGLATVVRGLIDRPTLAKRMRLKPSQRVILAQTVGYATR
jgi:nitroreductase